MRSDQMTSGQDRSVVYIFSFPELQIDIPAFMFSALSSVVDRVRLAGSVFAPLLSIWLLALGRDLFDTADG